MRSKEREREIEIERNIKRERKTLMMIEREGGGSRKIKKESDKGIERE